eukprot:CAMPEP_0172483286 /NCGR_PEP_ID=MMETSP1066-20121228/10204_1 /TAXON_ID=671091 /ORGANISM="Coscinodiscus wailesii, Strain CCMP2513" /LENGTH=734 /DNA_ID=CAMNT_0013247061 /DNA_START=83 /DNA_END=2287 /DNA_ORIENTATION=+
MCPRSPSRCPKSTPLELTSGNPPSAQSSLANRSSSSSSPSTGGLCKNLATTFDKHAAANDASGTRQTNGSSTSSTSSSSSTPLLSVYLRIRPCDENTIDVLSCQTKVQTTPPECSNAGKISGVVKEYSFEKVFGPCASQGTIFDDVVTPVIQTMITNQTSGLVFAYGSTNAGKTHTIFGNDDDWGILPRAMESVIKSGYNANMSYLEIYNEQIYDLLGTKSEKLKLREDKAGKIYAEGLSKHPVTNLEQGLHLTKLARQKRHTSSNNINTTSSRSHSICQLELNSPESPSLYLIDLAGAERSKRTNTRFTRLREANIINTSLMNLNKCLVQMQNQQQRISFRESKLTHLFMNHLQTGVKGSTVMIVNVNPSPDDYDETQSILGYASVAKNVRISMEEFNKRRMKATEKSTICNKRKRDTSSTERSVPVKRTHTNRSASNPSKVAKILKKMSPQASRKRKMELEGMRTGKVLSESTHRPPQPLRSMNRLSLQKEVENIKKQYNEVHEENQKLNEEIHRLKEEMVDREDEIRTEVANEMQARISAIKEHYEKISKSSFANGAPTPSRSVRKLKAERTQQIIDELQENVDECEEEMQRMRQRHKEDMANIQLLHEEALRAKDAEIHNLKRLVDDKMTLKTDEIKRLKQVLYRRESQYAEVREENETLKSQLGEVIDDNEDKCDENHDGVQDIDDREPAKCQDIFTSKHSDIMQACESDNGKENICNSGQWRPNQVKQ